MAKKKKSYSLTFVRVGDRSDEIIRALVKREIEKILARNGAVSYNLDEVLNKYISEEMRNGQKGQGLCKGIDSEGLAEG